MHDIEAVSTEFDQLSAAALSGDPRRLVRAGVPIGVLLAERELAALEQSLAVLATVGAREAIAEGLADLAAGRVDDWTRLRTDYGRGDPDEPPTTSAAPQVLVSHRGRWDLELLPPELATNCFDLLDELAGVADSAGSGAELDGAARPLKAGFTGLSVAGVAGFRAVFRIESGVHQIVHLDAPA